MLHVQVCPISGGGFVSQIGLILEWSRAREKVGLKKSPDLVMAASGGNVASYVTLAGQYTWEGVERVSAKLESQMFVRSWWPDSLSFLPTSVIGFFVGSLYRPGYGVSELFKSLFSKASVQSVEIWTGTFNKSTRRARLFCNKSFESSYLKTQAVAQELGTYSCENPYYLQGDLELLSKICIASASIPMLVEEQVILGQEYMDGGTMYASSLNILSEELYDLINNSEVNSDEYYIPRVSDPLEKATTKSEEINDMVKVPPVPTGPYRLELLYVASYDMDRYNPAENNGIAGEAGATLATLVHSVTVVDRNCAIRLFERTAGPLKVTQAHYDNVTFDTLVEVVEELKSANHYMVCIYPYGSPTVNMISFNGKDIVETSRSTITSYGLKVWYC